MATSTSPSNAAHSASFDTSESGALRVRHITTDDLRESLRAGCDDFMRQPSQLAFLALIYPVVGVFLARLAFGYEVMPLLFPLVAGFALLGPLTAVGLYEMSRRRQAGLPVDWRHAFDVIHSRSFGAIAFIGFMLVVLYLCWLTAAMGIYDWVVGSWAPSSTGAFLSELLTSRHFWPLFLIGNGVGLIFAVLAMCLSVVSLPLLVDRQVSLATAVRTSFAAVLKNPVTMAQWGVLVLGAILFGSLPFFIGLAVVLPVLGHATWHLYRRLVV